MSSFTESVVETVERAIILAWKRQAVAGAIRNLVLLGWMRLSPSESLAEAAGG